MRSVAEEAPDAYKNVDKVAAMTEQAGVTVEIKLLEAVGKRIANIIVEEAECWSAELIIIGTHGRSGFSRLLLGSIAESVVRVAHTPILLIRCTQV